MVLPTKIVYITFEFLDRILRLVDEIMVTFVDRLAKINSAFCFPTELLILGHDLEIKNIQIMEHVVIVVCVVTDKQGY